jgi:hypothetical protein
MSLLCSQCAHVNPDHSTFCLRCGNQLQSIGQPFNTGPTSSQSPPPYSATGTPVSSSPGYSPPSISPYNQPSASPYLSYAPASQSAAPSGSYPIPIGTGQGQISLRRAFAGYGTLIYHHSWLINGGSEQAANARATILDILRQRNITGLNVNPQKLMERGVLMEERDYLVARRGVSTVFTYTAPAGNDLYISRATTVLPAISNVRIVVASLLLLIMIIGFVAHPSSSPNGGLDIVGSLIGGLFSFLSGLILLFFIYALIRSFIYWLVEKDFWVLLRANHLNDFQLDDIMLLEHVTDDTVKTAVKQVGLDASQVTPPTMGYQPKRRIRTL